MNNEWREVKIFKLNRQQLSIYMVTWVHPVQPGPDPTCISLMPAAYNFKIASVWETYERHLNSTCYQFFFMRNWGMSAFIKGRTVGAVTHSRWPVNNFFLFRNSRNRSECLADIRQMNTTSTTAPHSVSVPVSMRCIYVPHAFLATPRLALRNRFPFPPVYAKLPKSICLHSAAANPCTFTSTELAQWQRYPHGCETRPVDLMDFPWMFSLTIFFLSICVRSRSRGGRDGMAGGGIKGEASQGKRMFLFRFFCQARASFTVFLSFVALSTYYAEKQPSPQPFIYVYTGKMRETKRFIRTIQVI